MNEKETSKRKKILKIIGKILLFSIIFVIALLMYIHGVKNKRSRNTRHKYSPPKGFYSI